MTRPTLTDDEVQLAMNLVLREAQEAGRRPTITAVERRLDVKHATFYRNFPHLITWFQEQADAQRDTTKQEQRTEHKKTSEDIIADLRRENIQLRRTVGIYAEALRQLTLDYEKVCSQIQHQAQITDLASRRKQSR
ncbi:hypothetical protein GTY20_09165 [Streptomyces sp. SID4946]|uniref:hypothetical protein n=1 Tax=Streptomyces sp. LamerLS-31b TaxID=1839765 RepID=UPI00081DD1F8|nr:MULTISPECIES: hypothetical protein [unclassified Streptomyces]MYQ91486.1 hypothetical protein [Streptomyces sp. SID4946]SCF67847.1 hypothetical protein GA0115256_111339 [Streptomyces sp. DconLS]SCF75560.1 hypothetical protein GA0115258_11168 [Streptomyces sp. LamerLS-31b]